MTSDTADDRNDEQLARMMVEWDDAEQAWRQSLDTPEGAVYCVDGDIECLVIGTGSEVIESGAVHTGHHR